MRCISFAMTTAQVRAREKDVTRRRGWEFAKAGMVLRAVEKGQGLKKGEKVVTLGFIRLTRVTFEPLDRLLHLEAYGRDEVRREGFAALSPSAFVDMFCRSHACRPCDEVTRIEFVYVDEPSASAAGGRS